MQDELEFKLITNFKCKRCGCTKYDKLIYTGMQTLVDKNSIIAERYVCRNCDFVFSIESYLQDISNTITISSYDLLNKSIFKDEGVEIKNKGE